MDTPESLQAAVSGLLGAGGAAAITRWLFARMIASYDQLNEKQSQKIEELSKDIGQSREQLSRELGHARERLAVLDAYLDDSRRLRSDLEAQVNCLRGEIKSRDMSSQADIDSLRKDLFIAHERIRKLANGDTDFSGMRIPEKINRR